MGAGKVAQRRETGEAQKANFSASENGHHQKKII